jgi:hypothetical protein
LSKLGYSVAGTANCSEERWVTPATERLSLKIDPHNRKIWGLRMSIFNTQARMGQFPDSKQRSHL